MSSLYPLFDAHTHPQFPEFNDDRDAVIARARAAGVKMITVGTTIQTSRDAIALAEKYPDDMWATAGTHPTESIEIRFQYSAELRKLAVHPKVIAIGECGLDYYRISDIRSQKSDNIKKQQRELFSQHREIAREAKKALMIHCRPSKGTDDAYEDLVNILEVGLPNLEVPLPNIIHFFVGSRMVATQLLALGCYFTFGGVITFTRDYDESIRSIPLNRILIETDAPFVAPEPYRGKRNEPAYVVEVFKKLTEIKGVTREVAHRQLYENIQYAFDV